MPDQTPAHTDEIELLRAKHEAAADIARDAATLAKATLSALNAAVADAAAADLAAQGIVIGKTPVEYACEGWRGSVAWQASRGYYLVVSVGAYAGKPDFKLAKIKKDGTPSSAGNGVYGQVVAVRPAIAKAGA